MVTWTISSRATRGNVAALAVALLMSGCDSGQPSLDSYLRDHCGTPPDGQPVASPEVQAFVECGDFWAGVYFDTYGNFGSEREAPVTPASASAARGNRT